MPDFKVFYADGETYTGDAYNAPVLGVLAIVEKDAEHGRRIVSLCDYYCWADRGDGLRWWGVDFIGMIDYLMMPGPKRVLIGRLVANPVYSAIYQQAMSDPEFPVKTAFAPCHHGRVI